MPPPQNSNLKPSMERVDPDEQLIATIYRHPFGLVAIYIQVFLGLIVASSLLFYIMPNFVDKTENPGTYTLLAVVLLVVGVIMVLILLAFTIIYHRSKLMISSKSITQITQIGLFNRKVSQLAISNIEDATAVRKGIFQTALNYGTLNVETAGEQNNFHFSYCPQPDLYSKYILEAREKFVERFEYDVGPNSSRRYQQQYYQQTSQSGQQYAQQQRPPYPPSQGYPEQGYIPTPHPPNQQPYQQQPHQPMQQPYSPQPNAQNEYQNQDQVQQFDHQSLPATNGSELSIPDNYDPR